jgi:hypothetical protein
MMWWQSELVPCTELAAFKTELGARLPVAHACNPSYLGDREQEDSGLKPAQANICETLSWK